MLDQSRADRITEYIAENGEEMAVLLNRKTFESALPHMPMTAVMLVISPNMTGHPPLHEWAENGSGGWLHHKMKVIRHETHAEHLDGKFRFGVGEQIKEGRVIAGFVEDRRAPVPPIQHMVRVPGHLSAWYPRHDLVPYAKSVSRRKKK